MNLATNCKNCGAVMQYSRQYYGKMYKCPYCGTEHHIDLLGRIEDYKMSFMWMGHIFEVYLSSVECQPIFLDTCTIEGKFTSHKIADNYTFEFIGNLRDKEDK
jgi:hypothetical protein